MGISLVSSTMSPAPNLVELYKGQDKDIELILTETAFDVDKNPIDVPFDLTGCTLYFQVRSSGESTIIVIGKKSTDITQILIETPPVCGKAIIHISHADTEYLEPGKYLFDVWVKRVDGKRYPVVELSEFVIKLPITIID